MTVQLAKGVRDYEPKEMILRQKLIAKLTSVFERYGFNPFETPIIERYDVLASKFGAGDQSDAMKEVFKLRDQGNRELGLRFELTLSMCRYIAQNPNIRLPFKRYEIGRVYRDGPIKLGRMREFMQCDVDIVGTGSMLADVEIIRLGIDALKELGLDAYIEVNNRKILKGLLASYGIQEQKKIPAIITIDKLGKIGKEGVKEELQKEGINAEESEKLLDILCDDGNFDKKISLLKDNIKDDEGKEGIRELEELFSYLSEEDKENVRINLSLARGLSYYTGTIFEGYLRKSKVTSAICGGGRYNDMIGNLMKGNREFPGIGISFGMVPIMEAMSIDLGEDSSETVTKVFVVPIGNTIKDSLDLTRELRSAGIATEVDIMGRPISKCVKFANSSRIPFVLFAGEDEMRSQRFKLKDMDSGEEKTMTLEDIKRKLKD
ncbi:MAG: histidine--tRNA ligase [Candidatus Woesearchaeota archaeon]